MNYIEQLATAIRARIPAHLLPDGDLDLLFRIYAVLVLAKRDDVQLEDVHDAWAAWISGQNRGHPSLRPFDDLPSETQRSDLPYLQALRAVAAGLTPRREQPGRH